MADNELPPMETMLNDLAKVEGLGFFFQTLRMAMSIRPDIFTDGERQAVQNAAPLAGDSAVSGQEMGDEIDGSDPSQPAP